MSEPKISAISESRYNGGARIRRMYGSSTVTVFLVGYEGTPFRTWKSIEGFGPTPGDRKTYAIEKFKRDSVKP